MVIHQLDQAPMLHLGIGNQRSHSLRLFAAWRVWTAGQVNSPMLLVDNNLKLIWLNSNT